MHILTSIPEFHKYVEISSTINHNVTIHEALDILIEKIQGYNQKAFEFIRYANTFCC